MARIKDSSIEQVKAVADIVDVVSARTQLKKQGARYVGRCPFHEERTPSFSVNPTEKLYLCFGCGAKGDLIGFVRDSENVDFVEAIEWLADRFGVTLEYEETSPEVEARRRRRERLLELLDAAAAFYERYLWEAGAAEPAREYLAGRGLDADVCREYRLGLAPGGRTLAGKAIEKGFDTEELRAAGLVNRRGNDYFSQRIVFPLADARGRVLGFQARKLREDDPLQAKYVNSPEGELFQKGAILYGLDHARAAIAKQERAIVVEGNTDVLALRQAGLEPVVASMGTALTDRQLTELSRLTSRLYLCFDADAAGGAATLRGMELARRQGFDVQVVALPQGSDPADDPEGFARHLEAAASYPLHGARVIWSGSGTNQEKFLHAREFLAPIEDSPDRQEAVRFLADRLGLPPEIQAGFAPRGRGVSVGAVSQKLLDRGARLERDVLAGCIAHPKLVPLLAELSPEHFESEAHRALCRCLAEGREPGDDLVGLRAELDARAGSEGITEETGRELILRLHERKLRRDLIADPERQDLQAALARVRAAVGELV